MNPPDDIIGLLNVIAALLIVIIWMIFYIARLLKERDALVRLIQSTKETP